MVNAVEAIWATFMISSHVVLFCLFFFTSGSKIVASCLLCRLKMSHSPSLEDLIQAAQYLEDSESKCMYMITVCVCVCVCQYGYLRTTFT